MNRRVINNWNVFVQESHIPPDLWNTVTMLDDGYSAPGRYYHSWDHIIHCVTLLRNNRDLASDPISVEVALWFHDVIYEPGSSNNEIRSAQKAKDFAFSAGLGEVRADSASDLVLATDHGCPATGQDSDLIKDIDLSIFGSSPEVFDSYERSIRLEYSSMSEEQFAEGRIIILSQFLENSRIYRTDRFHDLFSEQARKNLAKSIHLLKI